MNKYVISHTRIDTHSNMNISILFYELIQAQKREWKTVMHYCLYCIIIYNCSVQTK